MRAQQLIVLAALAVAVGAAAARAEPYLTVRAGAKCSDCHTNLTGGGKRTPFPYIHSHEILHDLQILPIPARAKAFDGQVVSHISMGGDLRVRDTMTFQDHPNSSGDVPENKAFRSDLTSNSIDVQEFLLYLNVDLWPDVLSLYADEDFTSGAVNREVVGILRNVLPLDGYVKAGRFFPAYGLRVQDDEAYIRSNVGFTFRNPDEGMEVGIAPGPFFLAADVVDGVSGDKDVEVTLNGYTMLDDVSYVNSVLLGASYARQSSERYVTGWYGGTNFWRLTLLGEFDLIEDRSNTDASRDQFASYAEVDFLALTWLNLRGTAEFLRVAGDRNRTRYTIGAEPFIDKFIQPRIQYRINNAPGNKPELNTAELLFELHFWF